MTDQLTDGGTPAAVLEPSTPSPTTPSPGSSPTSSTAPESSAVGAGRWLRVFVAASMVVVLVLTGWTLVARHQREQVAAQEADARAAVRRTSAQLARAETTLAHVRTGSAGEAQALATTDRQLAQVRSQLSQALGGQYIDAATISALDTCLEGVQAALNQEAVGDPSGAAQSLDTVGGSCQAMSNGGP